MSDTMLLGVLRMPFGLAMATPTAQIQYHQRGVQAADEIEKLTRERDGARAEVALLLLESEVLAKHEGSPGREWHSAGAWLLPGDSINVVRAPLPEIKVES